MNNNNLETLIEELMFDLHTRSCDSLSNPGGDGQRSCTDHKDQLLAAFRYSVDLAVIEARLDEVGIQTESYCFMPEDADGQANRKLRLKILKGELAQLNSQKPVEEEV